VIELRDIVFQYPHAERPVLNGADFRLEPGERVALLGPNGAGKSTLLQIIVGLLRPSRGEVRVFGAPRKTEKEFAQIRGRVGLVFQDADDQLFCPTVEEDIAFGPLNLGKTRPEARRIVEETLDRLGLIGLGKRLTHTLSGGEKQLAALAAVLAMSPEVILFDEPLAALDENAAERIERFLAENPIPCVVISHTKDFLKRVCGRAVRLQNGTLSETSIS
jgi:cobalt/nickel transport system ATP-binding protein